MFSSGANKLVLNRDFGSAALLGELVAVARHVSVLSVAREASATLGERAARLALRAGMLGVTALATFFVVGAE